MIFRVPSYYHTFRCIAGDCKDNCCIGWEIDIDPETAEYYRSMPDAFGERLRSCICFDKQPHFILAAQDRCPFLNEHNLCDIITQLGESSLCRICSDHPRFFNWLGDVKEGGLGLCCEAAARLILTEECTLTESEIPDEECEFPDDLLFDCLSQAREWLFDCLREGALAAQLCCMLDFAECMQERTDNFRFSLPEEIAEISPTDGIFPEILDFLQTLEAIDDGWHDTLRRACGRFSVIGASAECFAQKNPQVMEYLRKIAVYFIWRHFIKGAFDGEYLSRVKLSVISTAVIGCLYIDHWLEHGTLTLTDCVEIAKNYSKEVEYSEENLEALLDATYELRSMTTAALKGMLG